MASRVLDDRVLQVVERGCHEREVLRRVAHRADDLLVLDDAHRQHRPAHVHTPIDRDGCAPELRGPRLVEVGRRERGRVPDALVFAVLELRVPRACFLVRAPRERVDVDAEHLACASRERDMTVHAGVVPLSSFIARVVRPKRRSSPRSTAPTCTAHSAA